MMTVESSALAPGARLAGRYVVEQCVRTTALMSVYVARAETASSARFTARVVPHPNPGGDTVAVVNRELQRVAMLKQRAVPTLVAVARDPAGLVVITERPEGPTLRDHLAKAGRFRPNEVARMIAEVAMVLDALHAASPSIVHRSLSPDHVAMADRMLRLWVEECGLAQALTAAGLFPPRASTAATAYRSPGDLVGQVSPAGDLFSLASIAYECLVGAPAFTGADDDAVAAAIRGSARPSAAGERGDVPAEVDTVLQRAWSDEPVYGTAGAFARDLSRVLLTNPAARASVPMVAKPRMPVVTGTRERQIPHRPANSNKTTLLGLAPGASGDRPTSEDNPMKATLLGVGAAPRGATRPAAPARPAAPLLQPPTPPAEPPPGTVASAPLTPSIQPSTPLNAPSAPAITESDVRPRLRRPTETTQRVEVPRIRPPGTEPVQSGQARVKVPLATGRTVGGELRVDEEPTVTESGEQPVPKERLSDGAWGEIEASLGALDADSLESVATVVGPAPSAPPPTPPSPLGAPPTPTTAAASDVALAPTQPPDPPAATMFDLSDADFDPVVPAARDDAAPITVADDSISIEPELGAPAPAIPIVMPPTPIAPLAVESTPPPMPLPTPTPAPAPPAMPMQAPAPPAVAAAMPMVQPWTPPADAPPAPMRPVVPQWAPTQPPPSDPTMRIDLPPQRRWARAAVVAGLTVLVAGVVAAAGWAFLHKDAPPTPPVVVRRTPTRPALAAHDAGTAAAAGQGADASVALAADASAALAGDASATVDASAVVAAADVAVVAAPDASVVAAATDAAVAAAPDASVVAAADAGEPEEPEEPARPTRLHSHPRSREIGAFTDALTPEVQRCVAGSTRHRRVRIGVVWEGSTGRATEIHVASTYAEAPMGPCLENAVRSHPITRFTDRDFETSLTFEAR